jgi:hypothetical protein
MQDPNSHGKGDFGTPDADRLFHEVHSQRLDIILTIGHRTTKDVSVFTISRKQLSMWHCSILERWQVHSLEAPLDVFDHQTRLPNLTVPYHPYFEHYAIRFRQPKEIAHSQHTAQDTLMLICIARCMKNRRAALHVDSPGIISSTRSIPARLPRTSSSFSRE